MNKLVLFYPALCIPDDARADKMMFAKFDPKNIPERINCGPMKLGRCYPADVIDMDPIMEISIYRGPVLIVYGTKDNIVKPDYSRQSQRAYPNAKLHIREAADLLDVPVDIPVPDLVAMWSAGGLFAQDWVAQE